MVGVRERFVTSAKGFEAQRSMFWWLTPIADDRATLRREAGPGAARSLVLEAPIASAARQGLASPSTVQYTC